MIYIHFTHITASNTATDDVIEYCIQTCYSFAHFMLKIDHHHHHHIPLN